MTKRNRIQDLHSLEQRIYDAVCELLAEGDKNLGIGINSRTLECGTMTATYARANHMEWRETAAMVVEGEPCMDAVCDMAAEYCIV